MKCAIQCISFVLYHINQIVSFYALIRIEFFFFVILIDIDRNVQLLQRFNEVADSFRTFLFFYHSLCVLIVVVVYHRRLHVLLRCRVRYVNRCVIRVRFLHLYLAENVPKAKIVH